MKKLLLTLSLGLFCLLGYSQCPLPATSFVGDYNIVQVTPNNPFLNVPSINTQVISLAIGANPNSREFTVLFAEDLGIMNQGPMTVTFTLDCPNGNSVVVDSGIDTSLTCDQMTNITIGPAPTTGTFDQNDDGSFTLIIEEFQNLGGCNTTPRTVEFNLTKLTCSAPTGVTISNITSTTADVSWTDTNGAGTTFDVEYGVSGFALGTGNVISGVSGTSAQLTGLMEGNYYDVYVTSSCTAGTSIPSVAVEFLIPTDCNAVYNNFPLFEDFDSRANFDSCYTVIDEDANGTAWIQQTLELSPGNISTFATNGSNAGQKEDYLFSPPITLTAGVTYDIQVKYNGANSTGGPANEDLEVLMASNNTVVDANAGTSLFLDTGVIQNGDFAEVENQAVISFGQFTPSVSGDYYLVFKVTSIVIPPSTASGFLLVFDYSIDETLSVDQFETLDFDYFVDTQNVLNLSANQLLEHISLYNLLGQQVLNKNFNNRNEKVGLNELSSGVYLASLKLNGISKSFKIVKQ